jgi:hypothetical protein
MPDSHDQNPAPLPAPQNRSGKRSGPRRWLLIVLALMLLIYLLSPYYSFWRFTVALRAGDRNQLARSVDFPSLRKSLKQQLRSKITASPAAEPQEVKKEALFAGLSADFGPRLIDTLVDAYVTPEGLAAFLANPQIAKSPAEAGAAPTDSASAAAAATPESTSDPLVPSTEPGFQSINWSSVRFAFFTGPRDFVVDVEGTKLQYRFDDLRWQLKGVELGSSEIKL